MMMLNGEARAVPADPSVAGLLAELGLSAAKVAVERNREIVPRSAFADVSLAEGDVVEIVTFVGGG